MVRLKMAAIIFGELHIFFLNCKKYMQHYNLDLFWCMICVLTLMWSYQFSFYFEDLDCVLVFNQNESITTKLAFEIVVCHNILKSFTEAALWANVNTEMHLSQLVVMSSLCNLISNSVTLMSDEKKTDVRFIGAIVRGECERFSITSVLLMGLDSSVVYW